MIRLVLTDCDGTILPVGREAVSDRTLAAITALREAGIEFGPATGRPAGDLPAFFQGDASYCTTGILSCGKRVLLDGRLVFSRPIDRESLERACSVVSGFEDVVLVVVEDDPTDLFGASTWYGMPLTQERLECMREKYPFLGVELARTEVPEGEICLAGILAPEDVMPAARAALEAAVPQIELVAPMPVWCDINPRGWSKASGFEVLLDAMGIAPEEAVFIGDSENDLALMEAAPNALCVANGTPEAKAAAMAVIPAAEEDGPALFMEALARTKGDLSAALALLS